MFQEIVFLLDKKDYYEKKTPKPTDGSIKLTSKKKVTTKSSGGCC